MKLYELESRFTKGLTVSFQNVICRCKADLDVLHRNEVAWYNYDAVDHLLEVMMDSSSYGDFMYLLHRMEEESNVPPRTAVMIAKDLRMGQIRSYAEALDAMHTLVCKYGKKER